MRNTTSWKISYKELNREKEEDPESTRVYTNNLNKWTEPYKYSERVKTETSGEHFSFDALLDNLYY